MPWSKASVNSRWVRAEATQANANNRLLPVMIEACRRPIMFELTHTVDLSQVKAAVLAGVRSEMADWDVAAVEREGDEVLVELLRLKVGCSLIP